MSNWKIADTELQSRLLLGTAQYPSPQLMLDSVRASETNIVTVSLRRQTATGTANNEFYELIKQSGCHTLPNTAGCRTAKEAITTAEMAREIFATNWVKLEVIGNDYTLQPDPFALLEATQELLKQGFEVLPYCTDDLVLCQRLAELGCKIIMPWASPIGSGQGLLNPFALRTLRHQLPDITLIVDAGIGAPSHAALAMELGFDAVLLNSAVSGAGDPVLMARAFAAAINAGRQAYTAGIMPKRDVAKPSTPVVGMPFWLQENADA